MNWNPAKAAIKPLLPCVMAVAPLIAAVAALIAAVAAGCQARSASEQIVTLRQEVLVSQYTASVGMLGNAEISVRIRLLFNRLALLARELPAQFHSQTMHLLSAFIRQPPPAPPRSNELRPDVQAALDVIIYRSAEGLELVEASSPQIR